MRRTYFLFLLIASSFGPVLGARGQDSDAPSLGDVARQSRLAKQRKDAQQGNSAAAPSKDGETSKSASAETSSRSANSTKQNAANGTAQRDGTSAPQANSASANPAKRVLTNEDMGAPRIADSPIPPKAGASEAQDSAAADGKNPPDYWTSRIAAQKDNIASLKSEIDQLSASIQYAPGNCAQGCVEWNERQQQKQQQVDTMKAQLEEQQKQLEEMQEAARKQGYGSAVYDP